MEQRQANCTATSSTPKPLRREHLRRIQPHMGIAQTPFQVGLGHHWWHCKDRLVVLVNSGRVKGCFYSRPVDAEAAFRDFTKNSDLATALLGPDGAELCRYGPINERHEFELQRILRIRRSGQIRCCFACKRRRASVFQGYQTQESRSFVLETRSAMHIPRQSTIAAQLCRNRPLV